MGPEALKVEIRRVCECELVVYVCAVSLCAGKKVTKPIQQVRLVGKLYLTKKTIFILFFTSLIHKIYITVP